MLRGLRKKALLLLLLSQLLVASGADEESYPKVVKQVHDFEIALKAMDYLLDDRSAEGTNMLRKKIQDHEALGSEQPVGIYYLAMGVMQFIEATLGFEPEVMSRAHHTLSEAENSSMNNSKYNLRYNLVTSHIYPPGTEFQVTNAESTLLNALVMLLQENNGVVESAKALYKLRKAYHSLESVYKKIKDLEPAFNRNLAKLKKQASTASISSVDLPALGQSSLDSSTASLPQDLKLMRDLENVFNMRKARIEGTSLGNSVDPKRINLFANISAASSSATLSRKASSIKQPETPPPAQATQATQSTQAQTESDDDEFSDAFDTLEGSLIPSINEFTESSNVSVITGASDSDMHLHVSTIDEFIHSGCQLCFGILQVVLSLIPPAIGKVLSIVGFRGDRDVGLKLLWKTAITARNIHGDLALLCLLVFYDGPVQFVDQGFRLPENSNAANIKSIIDVTSRASITEAELDKILVNPDFYLPQVLDKVCKIFPHNALWVLQQGRVLASHGKLEEAIDLMQGFTDDPSNKIQMQQAEALLVFDRGMLYAFNHQFDEAAEDFIRLISMSSWCRSVYLLMAGSCYAAKWRMIKMGLIEIDDKEAQLKKYAELTDKYLKLAPTYVPNHGSNATGRKGGIGGGNKQLPFDKFVLRRSKHLEEAQKQYPHLSYVELMGASMIHELVYFWNGYNRMTPECLELSLKILSYSGAPNTPYSFDDTKTDKPTETLDESMIRYFLQAVCLRLLGRVTEGLEILDVHVISKFVLSDNPFKYNRLNYSPYICPTALYEKTMFVWLLKTSKPKFIVADAVAEARSWLKKASTVSDVGDYELSNRTSMRIKAATEKIDQIGETTKLH